jgi:hypothetical protein
MNYPIILVSDKISKAIQTVISNSEARSSYSIKKPELVLEPNPSKPDRFEILERRRLKFANNDIVFSICMCIVFVAGLALFVAAFIQLHIIWSIVLFLLTGNILISTFDFDKEKIHRKISEVKYNELLNDYNLNFETINKLNERRKYEFMQKKQEYEKFFTERVIDEGKVKVYSANLKATHSFSRSLNNRKRGKTELEFLHELYQVFGNQIHVDVALDSFNYYPDFVYCCPVTGLHIDIEIDEPYSFLDREPIHYKGCDDPKRNNYFLSENWCVIRFAEEQIIKQPKECVQLVQIFVDSLKNKRMTFLHYVYEVPKWTYEEARIMAYKSVRELAYSI